MTSRLTKSLGDVRAEWALPKWLDSIDSATRVTVADFSFGDLIATAQGGMAPGLDASHTFGIVLQGEAEIFDVSVFENEVAYRPIRVLVKNDIFGDFSVLDRHHKCASPAPRGEIWTLVGGRRSIISGRKLEVGDDSAFVGESLVLKSLRALRNRALAARIEPQIAVEERATKAPQISYLLEGCKQLPKTKVALIDLTDIDLQNPKHASLYVGLHRHSWPRTKAYRDAINSYNWRDLLDFRARALRSIGKGKKLSQKSLLTPFLDAMFDALNRPIRGEPAFVLGLPEWMTPAFSVLTKYRVDPHMLFCAARTDHVGEFYCPINLLNYFINVHVNFESEITNSKIDVDKRVAEVFGRGRSKTCPYVPLARDLIAAFRRRNEKYPYDVMCEWHDGGMRDVLMLKFSKNVTRGGR